ncbi:Hypothetical predicted protein [Mytilus galloprovincialis]|uniref:TGF-beta family profile domain-containing protein n=1 Tax=Mytilus galloprovincialis TaxID=29158 RepID=A0A8B6H8F5_MYTGA|nr:Hypothetical predicted protein [Mytilus galloprovincialis]
MGHTVMCVCTVYFTAIVGCAFSSPRLTSGENQQDDCTEQNSQKEVEHAVNAAVYVQDVDSENKSDKKFQENNINDTGGGLPPENVTVPENFPPIIDSETKHINDTESTTMKPFVKSKQIQDLVKRRHLEEIKEQLLAKLRLSFPPKLREPMPQLPMDEIQKVYFATSNDESYRRTSHFYAKTVRKFIVGTDVTHRCFKKRSTGCYYFDLRGRVDPSEVQSVQLWIYKLFNHNDHYMTTYVVSELEETKRRKNNLRIKNLVERYETTQKYGWLKIDVTKTAMKWLLKPRLNHGMAVICKDCQRKNYRTIYSTKADSRPFLVVTTRKSHARAKRSFNNECTDTSTECCLMPFTVNFRDIGWDSIAHPQSIQANYCTGSCHARYAMTTNHTSLIQEYRWTKATEKQMDALTPCCAPISYRPQSILYFDGDKVQETRIPNIAVTACGCV